MKLNNLFTSALMVLNCTLVLAAPEKLSPADENAAYKAAGFVLKDTQWHSCDDPTPTYSPGMIEQVRDINGDNRPEAVISEGGTYCYGNTGAGYSLVSKQTNSSWKLITSGTGIINFLTTKGVGDWLDIEIGGPSFCFPVNRWNGKEYVLNRYQYEGKRCRPNN